MKLRWMLPTIRRNNTYGGFTICYPGYMGGRMMVTLRLEHRYHNHSKVQALTLFTPSMMTVLTLDLSRYAK